MKKPLPGHSPSCPSNRTTSETPSSDTRIRLSSRAMYCHRGAKLRSAPEPFTSCFPANRTSWAVTPSITFFGPRVSRKVPESVVGPPRQSRQKVLLVYSHLYSQKSPSLSRKSKPANLTGEAGVDSVTTVAWSVPPPLGLTGLGVETCWKVSVLSAWQASVRIIAREMRQINEYRLIFMRLPAIAISIQAKHHNRLITA